MKPIIYIDVIVCGQITETIGFEEPKEDESNVFQFLDRIDNVFKKMKALNHWDNYRINHICTHGINCTKIKNVEIFRKIT